MNLIELQIDNSPLSSNATVTMDPAWIASVQTCVIPGRCFINLKDGTTLQIECSYDDLVRDWKQARL